ncbi:MAG: arginine--tRNA ligase [candidate division WOR-3 bacterium]
MTEIPAVYFLARCRQLLSDRFAELGLELTPAEIRTGEPEIDADLAVPVFRLAKTVRKSPEELAHQIAETLNLTGTPFAAISASRGYVNLKFQPCELARRVFEDYHGISPGFSCQSPERYGSFTFGTGKTIVIDYSSPNIAKPFSVGHLRSTVIGQALYNIYSFLGYRVIGDNHLGDWGTQFGKLLCAYEMWGDAAELSRSSTRHLLDLYIRFHQEAKEKPELEKKAREWFRRLETGDPVARTRWQEFVRLSRQEFERVYQLLGVRFDHTLGESFYAPRLQSVINRALRLGIARREKPPATVTAGEETVSAEETVVLIPLDRFGIKVPLLLQKSDGTSLYATREIATAEYRIEEWHPEKILYVVGNEQEFYFKQFSAAMKLLGYDVPCIHVNFGLIRLPEGRLSTRAGRFILLEDVIHEAIERAMAIIQGRDLPESEKEEIARRVGVGAIKYADLSQNRVKEVVFDWNRMLALDGDSGPYLQYAYTRTRSIMRKAGNPEIADFHPETLVAPEELNLLKQIALFPDAVIAAAQNYEPHRIANRIYRLTRDFSVFYDRIPVLTAPSPELKRSRLVLVEMVGTVIRTGLKLLGIEVMERM